MSEEETRRWAERFDHVALLIASALDLPGEQAARNTCERLDAICRRVSERVDDGGLTMHVVAALQAAIHTRFETSGAAPALH